LTNNYHKFAKDNGIKNIVLEAFTTNQNVKCPIEGYKLKTPPLIVNGVAAIGGVS
jgi:hypothetical protein